MTRFRLPNGTFKNVAPEHLDIFKERYPNAVEVSDFTAVSVLSNRSDSTIEIEQPSFVESSFVDEGDGVVPTGINVQTKKIKGELAEVERNFLGVVQNYATRFTKGWLDPVNNFFKGYETGEFGIVGEILIESPFRAALGYGAEKLREKGHDIPNMYYGIDLTTPRERRAIYEDHMLDMAKNGIPLEIAQKLDPTNLVKLEGALKWLDERTYTPRDENGNPLDYLDLFEQGEITAGLDAFVGDLFGGIPSLMISRLPYGSGAAFLGAGSYMENFERELYNRGIDDETTRGDIVKNSVIHGGADMVWEFIGGRAINSIAKKGMSKVSAEKLLTGLPRHAAKKMGLGFITEFVTEGATGVTQEWADHYTFSDKKSMADYTRRFFKDGFVGGFLGAGAVSMSTPNKHTVYDYVASQNYKQEQLKIERDIIRLEQDFDKANEKDKPTIREKIQDLKDKKEKNKKNLYSFFDNMTDVEKQQYARNIDNQHKQLDIIGNNAYSKETQEDAAAELKKATEANNKFFAGTDLNYDSDLEAAIGRTLKASERIQKQKGFFGFSKKNLDVEWVDSDSRLDELNEQYAGFDKADGMFVDNSGKKPKIYINTKIAAAAEATNVIGHEYLHAIVSNAFSGKIGAANLKSSISSFVDYLKSTGKEGENIVSRIEERLANKYEGRDADGNIIRDENGLVKTKETKNQEEYFTLFSDIIEKEKINIVENKSAGIKNSFRALIRGFGFGEVDFQSGQEVFDFLVDYKTNMERSSLLGKVTSRRIAKVKMKGLEAKGDALTRGGKMSKTASDNVQRIYEEQGEAGAMDIIDQFKPITNRIAETRRGAPNFDKELLMSEIEIGERGIYDLIRTYDPAKGVPLAAYINDNLPKRAIEASRRVLGEEFVEDVAERTDIVAEEVTPEVKTKPKKKKIVLSDRLGVTDKVSKAISKIVPNLDVDKLTFKNLNNKIPEIVGELFGISPKKLITNANISKKELQSAQMFINKNADLLLTMLPEGATPSGTATGVPRTLLNAFYTKTGRAKMAKTGTKAGLAVQVKKPNITKKDFLKEFGIIDGKPIRTDRNTSARVLALANQLGKMITNQAVRQELGVKDAGSKKAINRLKEGKSRVMFAKSGKKQTNAKKVEVTSNIFKNVTRKGFKHGDISSNANAKVLGVIIITKEGKDKKYSVRDLYNRFQGSKIESGEQARNRVMAEFLAQNPEYYETFQNSMAGGITISMFLTTKEFENSIARPDTKMKTVKHVKYNDKSQGIKAKDSKGNLKTVPTYNKKKHDRFTDKNNPKYKETVKNEKAKLPLLKDLLLKIQTHVNPVDGKPQDIWFFEEMTKDAQNNMGSVTRITAPKTAHPVDLVTGDPIFNEWVIEEHSFPAIVIARTGVLAAQAGVVETVWPVIEKSYMQLPLLQAHDNLVTESGMKSIVPDVYYDKIIPNIINGGLDWLPNGYAAVVRYAAVGTDYAPVNNGIAINLNGYKLDNEGQTWTEFFGVQVSSDIFNALNDVQQNKIVILQNELIIQQLAGDITKKQAKKEIVSFSKSERLLDPNIESRNIASSAVMYSRSSKNPVQGMSAWDFDDTVARTKSGVRYTMPNPEGVAQPERKVIFLAGGAGSGKSNVVKQLGLENQGFKVVNSDISLEWLKKNSGLPADMKDLTPKQLSQLGKLQWEARKIAARKQMKFKGEGNGIVVDGTGGSMKVMEKQVQEFKDAGYDVQMMFVETSLETALERNAARKERTLKEIIVRKNHEAVQNNKEGFRTLFGDNFAEVKTDNLKINDPMPQVLVNKMDKFTKGYIKGRLTAEEFAMEGANILEQGGKFDFTEFDVVTEGEKGPLFGKAMGRAKKYGVKDNYIITARPHAAKTPIFEFLKSQGLNIPLGNIITLENSTAEAKALWIAEKIGEGYNDIYFADDALQNVQAVQNMLDQFDVKGETQQANVKFSNSLDPEFNKILEDVTGIDAKKRFSDIKARKRGANEGKFRFFIPPSHEDFVGIIYNFLGKGRKGNKHRDFFEKALIRPLNRAYRELNTAKQSIANDYKSLNKEFGSIKNKLNKKTPDGDFTYQDAIRVYLWNKHGHSVPGLSKTDQQNLVDLVMGDPELQTYAEALNVISKQDKYVNPTAGWESGDIRTDLDAATGRVGREQFFGEFFENADIIFSPENMNKIEAAYGPDMVSAIKDILYRTKTGRNRPQGQNKLVNKFLNYLNGSVAATMFFNMRSAVLQQMSMVNFINFADNNIFTAAKAFANQSQYWNDWATIFNSDFMKQRRGGIKTDVNGAELAASVKHADNPVQLAIRKLLELGFLPTQIGDNIAIATGGATFYRNRINTYLKQGLSKQEAQDKAWIDFQVLAEATQQSARPDMVSQQQASPLGKIILAFQNVTSQFNRIGKKAFLDLKNRRITPGNTTQFQSDVSNISRIGYYFAIQNLIFYSLQSALFAAMFDEDEEDERWLKKKERVINGSIDSVLRGSGVMGGVIATLKNMAIKWHLQRDKKYNPDESSVLLEMLNVSPPLGIKARKMVNAEKTLNYNKKVINEMETFDIDNPMWSAVTNYTEAVTNIPLNRLYNKTQNVRQSLNNQHSAFERALMFSGWSQWNLGIENEKMEKIKEKVKKKKKSSFKGGKFKEKKFK